MRKRCRGGGAVGLRGLEDVGRQRLQPGEQDQRHERRPLPGVDDDQRAERGAGIAEESRAAATVPSAAAK